MEVDERAIKVVLRYLKRSREEVAKKLSENGIRTVRELARAEAEEVARALDISVTTAKRIISLAEFVDDCREEEDGDVDATNTKDSDREIAPYLAAVSALSASGGATAAMIVDRSFVGKTTMAGFATDVLVKPRDNAVLSTAGMAEALHSTDYGVTVDDIQRAGDISGFLLLARSVAERDAVMGSNRRYERRLREAVSHVLNRKLVVAATWDLSMRKLQESVKSSDLKRLFILTGRPSTVRLPYKVKRFMVRGYTTPFSIKSADVVDEIEDYSDVLVREYKEYGDVSEVTDEVSAVITAVSESLGDGEEVIKALYWSYRDIVEVDDTDMKKWWREVTGNWLMQRFKKTKVDCGGSERIRRAADILFIMAVSSMLGWRYDWDVNNWSEFKECLDLVSDQMIAVTSANEVGRTTTRKTTLMEIAKKLEPPFRS